MDYQIPRQRRPPEGPTVLATHPVPPVSQPTIHGWLDLQRTRNQPQPVPYLTTTVTAVTSSLDWMQQSCDVVWS